jgi:D-alanyl-lipoteichoic acid acyltransferase DltB (MBOAT superfamily)
MIFTSYTYIIFLAAIFILYWISGRKIIQNIILLVGSYIFYGYIHPWFCILIAASTIVDYFCGLGMGRFPDKKKLLLVVSLISNLGMLGVFKYFNFFAANFQAFFLKLGMDLSPITFQIYLPVGISFYTFQTLSYTIDIYKGELQPRKNFLDFALFVSFFAQLVAGPIERAKRFLPQVENPRRWDWNMFASAWPLLIRGFLKKMVIADNVAVFTDKVYMLYQPSVFLLFAATVAFAIQIYMDFSGYTDIARGSARLIGFDLVENFKSPYRAISPSDFWRRWHISFSSWIRDYLYIPLGGSRVQGSFHFFSILFITMGLAGLWHGADWHFIWWGLYHGALVFIYHKLGKGGHWQPVGRWKTFAAWAVMFTLTLFGWMLFRTSSMAWLYRVFFEGVRFELFHPRGMVALYILAMVLVYCVPLMALGLLDRYFHKIPLAQSVFYGLAFVIIVIFARDNQQDFIYFQF